jgi:hypothetical protein
VFGSLKHNELLHSSEAALSVACFGPIFWRVSPPPDWPYKYRPVQGGGAQTRRHDKLGVDVSSTAGYRTDQLLEPRRQIIRQLSFNQANDGLGPAKLHTTSGATGRRGQLGRWTIRPPSLRAIVWRDRDANADDDLW